MEEQSKKLLDLKEDPNQKKILSDEYIKKSAPAFFVSEPEASIMTNKWIEGAMWYRKEMNIIIKKYDDYVKWCALIGGSPMDFECWKDRIERFNK